MAKIPVNSILAKGAGQALSRGAASIPSGSTAKQVKFKPGEHWSNPTQEQHPDVNRFFTMNFAGATPETMGRELAKNFEVKPRGGLNFSIRKPGEKEWKVVDPNTWSDWVPFFGGDWSDIMGDIATGIGSMVGATMAAPGLVTTPLGAAAGGAAVETGKQALAKMMGVDVTAGEAAQSIGTEAVLGAAGEAAAPLVRTLGQGLVKGGKEITGRLAAKGGKLADDAAAAQQRNINYKLSGAPQEEIAAPGLAQKALSGFGKGVEKVGGAARVPFKAYQGALTKAMQGSGLGKPEKFAQQAPIFAALGPLIGLNAPGLGALGAIGAGEIFGRGTAAIGRALAADNSGQMLLKLATKAPKAVADMMFVPLEALNRRGIQAYRAAMYTLMHDPAVRAYLRSQSDKKDESLEGPRGVRQG